MTWPQLLSIFLRAAFLSVNGSTTLALLDEDLVHRYHVLSRADFATGVAVGAATPGPLGYGCIALGFLADGWRGALVATLTSWLPAFLAIPLRAGYRRLQDRPWMAGLTWGVGASGTGLLLTMVLHLGLDALRGWIEACIGALVLILLLRRVPVAPVIAAAALAGALFLR